MNEFEKEFHQKGYYLFENFFDPVEISTLTSILESCNREWKKKNLSKNSINSSYLTSSQYLKKKSERDFIFQFIASDRLCGIVRRILDPFYFLNTQLFFNPEHSSQLPYWHRDIQYFPLSEEEQKKRILVDQVLHFRIPLMDDPGLFFIPGSHQRWDHIWEHEIRLERNGHRNSESLPEERLIPHKSGDLLVFSAHLIHKGNYSKNRLSFDILYTNFPENRETVASFSHFPLEKEQEKLPANREIFSIQG